MDRDARAKASPAHLAALAGLRLTPSEEVALGADLHRIVAYVSELAAIDTGDVAPLASPTETGGPLRADEPARAVAAADVLAAAPKVVDGAFAVPRILD